MNWKLILQLSLFGLAMGFATVFVIPSNVEPFCWLGIFAVCAFIIAKRCARDYFLHGWMVSMVNSVWITITHIALFGQYVANHPKEAEMMTTLPLANHPRAMMAFMGPVVGAVFGLVLGVFAVVAAKVVRRR